MDFERFFSQFSDAPSGPFNSQRNQDLLEEVRELTYRGLQLFPVSLTAKLSGNPNKFLPAATSDLSLLEELSSAAEQPLWGHRLALGPSGLCVLILDGTVGRASLAALVPDLDECVTLQARCGNVLYAFFRQPAGMKRIASAKQLAPGVSILGDGESCIVPPSGGAVWIDPCAEIEALPYYLRELLAFENPDNPPGRAIPAPKPSPRPVPCRSTMRFPKSKACGRDTQPATKHPGAADTVFTASGRLAPHLPSTTNANRPATSLSHGIAGRKQEFYGERNSGSDVHDHGQRAV
jgi:hypothetical protein